MREAVGGNVAVGFHYRILLLNQYFQQPWGKWKSPSMMTDEQLGGLSFLFR
jgi:hypothetical protein